MNAFKDFSQRYRRNWGGLPGLVILAAVVAMASSAPMLYPDPWLMGAQPMLWPGQDLDHPLGTDQLGRDIASATFHGARISLLIGLVAATAALLVGVLLGAISGYYGGWIDELLMRVTEVFQTIPPFILAVVIVAIFQPRISTTVAAIAIVSWPPITRLVRGEFIAHREREYVEACYVIGMNDPRIIFRHILPNVLSPIVVSGSVLVATAILIESGLSFLGLGDRNVMSWGTLLAIGRDVLRIGWYVTAIPGVAVLVTVLAINLIGEALNDALNPRLGRR